MGNWWIQANQEAKHINFRPLDIRRIIERKKTVEYGICNQMFDWITFDMKPRLNLINLRLELIKENGIDKRKQTHETTLSIKKKKKDSRKNDNGQEKRK